MDHKVVPNAEQTQCAICFQRIVYVSVHVGTVGSDEEAPGFFRHMPQNVTYTRTNPNASWNLPK